MASVVDQLAQAVGDVQLTTDVTVALPTAAEQIEVATEQRADASQDSESLNPAANPSETLVPSSTDELQGPEEVLEKKEETAPINVVQKKKKKSSGKNKKAAPTGFEEFYADPPLTPDQYEEEKEIYHPSISLDLRIEECLQRYKARRRLDNARSNILTKYFLLGGVESSTSKSYNGGIDQEAMENATARQIAAFQATDTLHGGGNSKFYNHAEPEGWVVDFEGVVKGFLSYRAPTKLNIRSKKDVDSCCATVKNFLNYVLVHNVCPEYTDNIKAACTVCDRAVAELSAIEKSTSHLPGAFNLAASRLYGGRAKEVDDAGWGWTFDPDSVDEPDLPTRLEKADLLFKTGVALTGDDALFKKVMQGGAHVTKTYFQWCEITEIERADDQTRQEYAGVLNGAGKSGSLKPLGVFKVKQCIPPDFYSEDFTDDEGDEEQKSTLDQEIDTFWLEDDLLENCFIGMIFELKIRELNIGMKYFEVHDGPYCSFFTCLPQELMADWKEPVMSERPAPTEDDDFDIPNEEDDGAILD